MAIRPPKPPLILGIDPSSTSTGYALLQGDNRLVTAGRVIPQAKDIRKRLKMMSVGIHEVICGSQPRHIIIEWTSGHTAGRIAKKRNMSNLATYGMGIAIVWMTADCIVEKWSAEGIECDIHCIKENIWTRGRPKKKRQEEIRLIYPNYDYDNDSGGDAADAIGIARYWMRMDKTMSWN